MHYSLLYFWWFIGSPSSGSLPPPPWEAQLTESGSPVAGTQYPQPMQVTQVIMTHVQSGAHPQGPQAMGNDQAVGMYMPPNPNSHMSAMNPHVGQNNQFGFYPQNIQGMMAPYMGGMVPNQMQPGSMPSMYPQQSYGNQYMGYGYGQQQQVQYLDQQMYGLSIRDDTSLRNSSYQVSTSSYTPPGKSSKPEDKLFGDLVDMAKVKPKQPTPGRAGSM